MSEDLIKKLNEDPLFRAILKAAESDKDRRFIKSFTEAFVKDISGALVEIRNSIDNDTDESKKQLDKNDENVVMDLKK